MTKDLRLVLTTGNYNYIKDGVALTLNQLVGWLERHGVEVMIVAPEAKQPALEHVGRLEPVPSFAVPKRNEYRIGLPIGRELRRKIRAFNPHLFHITLPDITGHSALRLARRMRVPAVSSYHTRFDVYLRYYRLQLLKPLMHYGERAFYGKCQTLFVPSLSMMEALKANGIGDDNMRLWTRGIDHARFNPRKRSLAWRRAHGVGDDEVLITFAGRLVAEKNVDLLIRVFNALKARQGPAHCTMLLGDGPEAERMRQALPDTVFAGFLHDDELATGYASSDIFFFPSASETFGNVTLEAMASGLPTVAADATGSRSLVREGETGFLVDPRDEALMTDRLEHLVGDSALRAEFGARAREIAVSEYDWDRIFAGLLADYGAAIAGSSSSAS